MKKHSLCLFILLLFISFALISCISETSVSYKSGVYALSSKTAFNDTYFALERDYNSEMSGKTNSEILEIISSEISDTLLKYNVLFDINSNNDTINISFTSTKDEIERISSSITSDENNPILFYENDTLKININRDNYMDLKVFLPILENETIYSYTAAFNADTTKDEYLEIISYVLSEDIAFSLGECEIAFTINDGKKSKNVSFTLLDFLLLHSPIVL